MEKRWLSAWSTGELDRGGPADGGVRLRACGRGRNDGSWEKNSGRKWRRSAVQEAKRKKMSRTMIGGEVLVAAGRAENCILERLINCRKSKLKENFQNHVSTPEIHVPTPTGISRRSIFMCRHLRSMCRHLQDFQKLVFFMCRHLKVMCRHMKSNVPTPSDLTECYF